jgi:zinc protease
MKPIFASAPIEINIVGDFDEQKILKIVEKYFGSLDKRKDFESFVYQETINFPKGKKLIKEVETNINKSIVNVIYPTCDKRNIKESRKLSLLASLIDERMRVVLREKLGETYSPFAHNSSSEFFKNFGFLRTFIFASPDKADFIVEEVKNIANDIRENGISEDEMIRIKKPVLTEVKEELRNNSYWLYYVLSGSSYNQLKFDWAKTFKKDYEEISIDDVNEVAKRYLKNKNSATVIIKSKYIKK